MLGGPRFLLVPAVLKALDSSHRRTILWVMANRPSSAKEVAEYLGIKQQTISYHMKVLQEAGLIRVAASYGAEVTYVVNSPRLNLVCDYVSGCLIPREPTPVWVRRERGTGRIMFLGD